MSSDELRNYATVVAATVALLVFMVNVWSQMRNRRIENLGRFNAVHQRLFAHHGYLDGIATDAERYKSLTPAQRAQFWR